MDGRFKIPPCVLQDIGPLGPLPKKELRQAEIVIWKDNPHGNTSFNGRKIAFIYLTIVLPCGFLDQISTSACLIYCPNSA